MFDVFLEWFFLLLFSIDSGNIIDGSRSLRALRSAYASLCINVAA